MKKTFFTLILLISTLTLLAQKSLLWEVSGNGLKHPSYIFGTIHLIPKKNYVFYPQWKQKLYECNTVVFEANIKPPLKEQIELLQKTMLPDNKNLQDFLPQDYYQKLYIYLHDTLKIKSKKIKLYMRFKPIFIPALILKEKFRHIKIYEKEIFKMAKRKKKKFYYLETLDYQLNIIDTIDYYTQALNFLYNPNQNYNLIKEYQQNLQLYLQQNIDSLAILTYQNSDTVFIQNLIIKRNKEWIPKLEKLFKTGPTFVAVGAGHLKGKYGILTLLQNKGYTIRPVLIKNTSNEK